MFTIKRGPLVLWTVTTVVQRTNDRINGIVGANPFLLRDYYRVAAFEVRVTTNVNLNLTEVRIYPSLSSAGANTVDGFPPPATPAAAMSAPIQGAAPVLAANQAVTVNASLPFNNALAASGGMIVPPAIVLEYSTAAPGATPNLVFEVRALFYGNPTYINEP